MTGFQKKPWSLLILNLLLQLLDWGVTYGRLPPAMAAASSPADAAMENWGAVSGLFYYKILACALLFLIYALRHNREVMAANALTITACVYSCYAAAIAINFWFR
jgi:hypothetical protein